MTRQTLKIADNLTLPLEIAGQAIALVGIRGSGKTNTAGVIAEELLTRHQQIVVIDPTDAWWGLRSDFPVFIFGGPHGDLPLNEGDGKTLAEFVVQEQVPIILSLRHLRKGAQRRLVTEFCEELYHLKGKPDYRTPLTVFIDEAPQFVPQRVTGDMARLVGAVQDMILLGRNAGFGVVLISQRFATLNADVRTQADTIIVHRLPSPLDRKALTDWIEENASIAEQKEVLSSLAKLQTGEAWIWAPYFELFKRAQVRPRKTFDSSAAPKHGVVVRAPKDLTKVDLEKLKGKLATVLEQAKADDPKALRARIVELEKQVAKPVAQANPKKETIRPPLLTDADRALLAKLADGLSNIRAFLARGHDQLRAEAELLLVKAIKRFDEDSHADIERMRTEFERRLDSKGFQKILAKLATITPSVNPGIPVSRHSDATVKREQGLSQRPSVGRPVAQAASGSLSGPEQRIVDAIAEINASFDIAQPDASMVAWLANYSPTSTSFTNPRGALRTKGLVDLGGNGTLWLTDAGRAAARPPQATISARDLQERTLARLSGPERRILQPLIEAHPHGLTNDEAAAAAQYSPTSTSYTNPRGRLASLGLITYPQSGQVRAADILFPTGGRP